MTQENSPPSAGGTPRRLRSSRRAPRPTRFRNSSNCIPRPSVIILDRHCTSCAEHRTDASAELSDSLARGRLIAACCAERRQDSPGESQHHTPYRRPPMAQRASGTPPREQAPGPATNLQIVAMAQRLGIQLKYAEPPERALPARQWRIYELEVKHHAPARELVHSAWRWC